MACKGLERCGGYIHPRSGSTMGSSLLPSWLDECWGVEQTAVSPSQGLSSFWAQSSKAPLGLITSQLEQMIFKALVGTSFWQLKGQLA